jgi:hypothetical protein
MGASVANHFTDFSSVLAKTWAAAGGKITIFSVTVLYL